LILIFCESSWLIYLGACNFICFFKHNLNSANPGLFGHFFLLHHSGQLFCLDFF
jgi:hypothetical protein